MTVQLITNAAQSKLVRDRLSVWETAAPLTEQQKDCVIELATWASDNPLPQDLLTVQSNVPVTTSSVHDHQPINNAQQFYEWFHSVERQMESDQECEYREYNNQLHINRDNCDSILHGISQALDLLKSLSTQYRAVSQTTGALHDSCEMLMQDQQELEELGNSIYQQLIYFTEHERIGSKLNSSSVNVMGEAFVPMLIRIDECVQFMVEHPHYKESAVYLAKYQQCLVRALTLLRSYIVNTIRATSVPLKPAGPAPMPNDPAFTQLYSKFRAQGPRIKALMEQIEERSERNPEYLQVMQDCYTCYCYQRQTLILQSVNNEIERLYKLHAKDQCSFIRSGCMLLVRICEDEHTLYHCFFSRSDLVLQGLLETLSTALYEYFRPLIIQQVHLESLADICSVLKNDIIEDQVNTKGAPLEAFGLLAQQMLEDAQERLSYRTQAYIQSDIQDYAGSPGDVAYPEKLGEDLSNQYAMWYPTVRRTLICLSKLYRCTNKAVFESLAQEGLSACIQSLRNAASLIQTNKTPLDSQLFLIKHLLILREQIAPFDVEFSVREMTLDFTNLKVAALDLLNNRKGRVFSLNSNNALLEFMLQGAPQLTEKLLDSKKDVDINLKLVCTSFIDTVTALLCSPLAAFLASLGPSDDVTMEKLKDVISEAGQRMSGKLPLVKQSMHLYLANSDTETILFRPVKTQVLSQYSSVRKMISKLPEEDQFIINCPSAEQLTMSLAY